MTVEFPLILLRMTSKLNEIKDVNSKFQYFFLFESLKILTIEPHLFKQAIF